MFIKTDQSQKIKKNLKIQKSKLNIFTFMSFLKRKIASHAFVPPYIKYCKILYMGKMNTSSQNI